MSLVMHFDINGEPMTFPEWVAAIEDSRIRNLAYTEVGNGFVSTIWLGLGHSSPPLIFETMAFVVEGENKRSVEQKRYATKAEALEGHEHTVAQMEAGKL